MIVATVNTYYVVVSVHTMAVLITFGAAFAYPLALAAVTRGDPRSLPFMHRLEYTIGRALITPGLLVVILTGAYATSEGRHWNEFYVQWGLAVAIVIGVLLGTIMIPVAERAAQVAARDVAASGDGAIVLSGEYRQLVRRLAIAGSVLSGLVVITILIMVVQLKP